MTGTTITPEPDETLVEFLDRCGDDLSCLDETLVGWLAESVTIERSNLDRHWNLSPDDRAALIAKCSEWANEQDMRYVTEWLEYSGPLEDIHRRWELELIEHERSGQVEVFDRVIAALPASERDNCIEMMENERQPIAATVERRGTFKDHVTGEDRSGACLVLSEKFERGGEDVVLSPETLITLLRSAGPTIMAEGATAELKVLDEMCDELVLWLDVLADPPGDDD